VESDGAVRYVYGKVTDGSVDSDEQIVDPAFARKALAEWYDTGANVRQMHSTQIPPAGKGVLLEHKEGDGEYVKTKVVDGNAIRLVDESVYQGYSVGIARPRIDRDMKARGGRIVGGKIVEISLVDRPALPTAKFAVLKAAGSRGSLEFIGKVVLLDDTGEGVTATSSGILPSPRRELQRIRKGAHVTVHARNEFGVLEAFEGTVITKGNSGIALDRTGYGPVAGVVMLSSEDIDGIFKGRQPLDVITKHIGIPDDFGRSIRNDSGKEITAALRRLNQWVESDGYPAGLDRSDIEKMFHAYTAEMRERDSGFDPGPLGAPLGLGRIGSSPSLTKVMGIIEKYSPDQERDEAGKWTAGGGGPESKPADSALLQRTDRQYSETAAAHGQALRAYEAARDKLNVHLYGPLSPTERTWAQRDFNQAAKELATTRAAMDAAFQARSGAFTAGSGQLSSEARDLNMVPDFSGDNALIGEDAGLGDKPGQNKTETTEAEDSVTKKATTMDGVMCDKCKGTGLFEGSKCDKCGGSKVMKAETPAVEKQVAQAHAAAADAHAAAAEAAAADEEPDDAADHAEAADDHTDAAEDAAEDEADAGDAQAEDDHPDIPEKKGFVPFKKKSLKIAEQEGKFVLTRKGTVLGTHDTREAAEAQKTAMITKAETDDEAVAWEIRKAHDWTCAAYKAADVIEVYPTIESDGAFGKATTKALRGALDQAVKADQFDNVANLGKAMSTLADLLAIQASQIDGLAQKVAGAREDLTVAFKAENPQIGDLPKPSESITPGQFKRPYISAGRQSESAHAKAPRIPETTHPIRATDFGRGPLTEGHQRYLAAKMVEFHDAIVAVHPDLCRMDANGSFAFDRQPAESFERKLAAKQVPNQDTASPKPVTDLPVTKVEVDQTLAVKTYTSEELEAAVTASIQPYIAKLSSLENKYDALASAPDPARSALRGVTGVTVNKVSEPDVKKALRKAARKTKRADKIEFYRTLASSPDSSTRIHAQDKLASLGVEP
jgi:hypothetical protein